MLDKLKRWLSDYADVDDAIRRREIQETFAQAMAFSAEAEKIKREVERVKEEHEKMRVMFDWPEKPATPAKTPVQIAIEEAINELS